MSDAFMLLLPTLGGHGVPLDLILLLLFSVDLPVILIVYSCLQSLVLNVVLCLATFCHLANSCVQLCPSLFAPLAFTLVTYLGKILISGYAIAMPQNTCIALLVTIVLYAYIQQSTINYILISTFIT